VEQGTDFQPMQSDAVAYRGQAIALVVANNLEAADQGRSAIRVEYETAPFAWSWTPPVARR